MRGAAAVSVLLLLLQLGCGATLTVPVGAGEEMRLHAGWPKGCIVFEYDPETGRAEGVAAGDGVSMNFGTVITGLLSVVGSVFGGTPASPPGSELSVCSDALERLYGEPQSPT